MQFQTPLIKATLVRRYKRFLADVILPDGREVTAHCGNPGAMLGLKEAGSTIWVEPNDDPKRKLKYAWKLIELPGGHWAGIDTNLPNRIVGEALRAGRIAELADYQNIQAEVKYGQNSRIDFLLTQDGKPNVYLEIKNVHLRRQDDLAEFPDSVTKRGTKHLGELVDMIAAGHRAMMFYFVQRTDCARFKLSGDIDPAYAEAFDIARAAGVEVLCYDSTISVAGINLANRLPVDPAKQS